MADSHVDVRAVLAQHDLLQRLPNDALDRLARVATVRTYKTGQSIFMRGDPGESMMVVVSGRIRISRTSYDGREVVLAVFGPGEVLGEIAMIDGGERTADAAALERVDLLILHRRDFHAFLLEHPAVAIELLVLVCRRLRDTDDQLEDLNFLPLRTRLAKRLVDLAEHFGNETDDGGVRIGIPMSQQFLANMIGTSREAVNKQLRSWEEDGIIALGNRTVTIVDPDALGLLVAEE